MSWSSLSIIGILRSLSVTWIYFQVMQRSDAERTCISLSLFFFCLFGFFLFLQKHTPQPCFPFAKMVSLASLAAIQVSLQCSLVMDSSFRGRLSPDNLQYTNMSYRKVCLKYKSSDFLFCYFCSIKLANAKLIKNQVVFQILSYI